MRLIVNLDSLLLVRAENDAARVDMIEQKRGDSASMEIIFVRSGVRVEHEAGTVVKFGAKEEGKYDSPVVVFEDGFVLTDSGSNPYYLGTPSFNTVPLDALLNKDGNLTNDKASVDLIGEISWGIPLSNSPTSTKTFKVRVHNDVIRDDEGSPEEVPDPEDYLTDRAVRYDTPQTLSNAQKEQAHLNMGWPAYDDLTAANAALAPGKPYYDRALEGPNNTTA